MSPIFPEFKLVSVEDNEVIETHNRKFPYYSDYNFPSLVCWDIHKHREWSLLNDNLVVKFTDYETEEPFFSYLGMNDTLGTTRTLLDYSESIGLPAELRLMPEISIHDIHADDLEIIPDRDNFDYVYLTSRMATLEGNQYKSKRQAANFFKRNHPGWTFEVFPLGDIRVQEVIRSIALSWKSRRDIDPDDQSIEHEACAIENIFKLAEVRDLLVGVLFVDGVPTSFTIEEIVNQIFSMGHFWKTANRVDGEYEFLASKMAAYLDTKEVTYLNWEQDLGIQTLRASKSSYRPSDFLKKFIVTRRQIS
ncbi:MAG: hypothetical protein AB203_02330 [Parcubacteria bacterium C7867-008]|nr:MAG: hypothetical protein AB203_02330 [Parcubacteria bacterium C7867-008]